MYVCVHACVLTCMRVRSINLFLIYIFIYLFIIYCFILSVYIFIICVNNPCLNFIVTLYLNKCIFDYGAVGRLIDPTL